MGQRETRHIVLLSFPGSARERTAIGALPRTSHKRARPMLRLLWSVGWLFCCCLPLSALAFQNADGKPSDDRLALMRGVAEKIKVRTAGRSEPVEVPLHAAPLLRFNDPARDLGDASLWAWGNKGRPTCVVTMERYGGQWFFELISLSTDQFTAELESRKWTPKAAGLQLVPFPDAPKPAKDANRRLPQMRDLLAKLRAHEVGGTGVRYELRLMPKPFHRYSDPDNALLDGGLFAFAYGTNPELLAVVEAHGDAPESAVWKIGFARCGTAEQHVFLDEDELIHLPHAPRTGPGDPYWNFPFKMPAAP